MFQMSEPSQAKIQELRESGLQLAGDTNNNGLFRVRSPTLL